MSEQIIREVEKTYMKTDLPDIRSGDLVSLFVKITEGSKQREQKFEGNVIAIKGSGSGKTINLRRVSGSLAVERIILLHSPLVSKIKILKRARVRRAKLYYLREKAGKKARIKYKEFRVSSKVKKTTKETKEKEG